MNYYILMEDKRINESIRLTNYKQGESKHFDDIAITEDIKNNTKEVDYIRKKFLFDTRHVVSDKVNEVIENLEEYIDSRAIFVISEKTQCVYWELKMKLIDCVIKESKPKIENIKLMYDKIEDAALFTIKIEVQEYIIVRFDIAELIMQKHPLGIKFIQIQTIQQNNMK